ncbi:MetQ/NlpA family ABC transporter substrate-binding protein [Arcanobacterium haemolyticum]|nr:MetQ/NlpA family ABC transporter substrate-binding protein [Arcanobacterium haemolyticum]
MKRFRALAALATASVLALSACGSSDSSSDSSAAADGLTTIVVGASPVPHADILKYVQENLAKDAGLNVEIKEYQDYVQPNVALQAKEIDANYFQHVPYFDEEVASKSYTFDHGTGIHIEPYGIYSNKIKDLSELADGATVAITNDPSNQARALALLEANGLIKLADKESPSIYDITENTKNLTFKEADAPSVPKLLPDVDIAIINGNYALDNNLTPSKDALYLESGVDNPYANVLAWNTKEDSAKLDAVKKLEELLHSEDVANYIKETWTDGAVVPAF